MRTILIIVCESSGDWAALLRRRVDADVPVSWIETRSPAEARRAWRGAGREAALVVELSAANAAAVCGLLVEHDAENARAPRIAVAGRSARAYERAAREAGATAFCTSPREIGLSAAVVARFAAAEASRPELPDDRSTAERLRAALPWSSAAR